MFYEVILGRGVGRLDGVLTYSYAGDSLAPGTIVEVPVGRNKVPGVVLKKVARPEFQCKEILKILYSIPLPKRLVMTATWMASYYAASVSSCLGMMLPVGVEKQRRARKTEQMFGFDGSGAVPTSGPTGSAATSSPIRTQARLGVSRAASFVGMDYEALIPLNPHQKNALQALQKAAGATKLLHGVTGSGKTNIYLRMALNALQGHKSVILLVPEIALTGQLVQEFRKVFGDIITTIHSKQTEAERHLIFNALLKTEEPRVVIGPRSALFAPVKELGLIIIDEEHETTYFQENAPKYSAIRVASYMASFCGCDCILGSATPTATDYYVAKRKGTLVTLTEKAKDTAVAPDIKIVDFKNRDSFSRNRYFCNGLLATMQRNLEAGQQTLIFHNRRGSSALTICENCGEELMCPNCFLPLTLHADSYELRCHTCDFRCKVPAGCPKCGHAGLVHKGFGTKLLETEIRRLFPKARVMRFDADSKKDEGMDVVYEAVKTGEVDILVGTQTLAKGLDLPKLATVGVVQADAGLSLPDYAAEERVFQLITQVIGRVGRGHTDTAEVFIQTFRPEHPVLAFATRGDYQGFYEYLLKTRRRGGFPPHCYAMKLSITMKTEATVVKKVREAVRKLAQHDGLIVSPPMPAFHERTARGYTWEIVVRGKVRSELTRAYAELDKNFRVTLDPPSLL